MPNEKFPGKRPLSPKGRFERLIEKQRHDAELGPREKEARESVIQRRPRMQQSKMSQDATEENPVQKLTRAEVVSRRNELIEKLKIVPGTKFCINEQEGQREYLVLGIKINVGLIHSISVASNNMKKIRDIRPDHIIPASIDHSFEEAKE